MSIELQPVMGIEESLITYDDLAALVSAKLHSYLVPQPRRFVDDSYMSFPYIASEFDDVMSVGVADGDVEHLADLIFVLPFVQDSLVVKEACCAT